MVRIIAIDPGSVVTGVAVIEAERQRYRHLYHGHLRVKGDAWSERLYCIFREISGLTAEYQPHEAAIEEVFMSKNAMSALKLGQARGAAICALAEQGLPVSEYPARLVKKTVVGTGAADKSQVQHMVGAMLGLQGKIQADAADALGIAICHAIHRNSPIHRLGVKK
ncbi:MAG: crossover junction endodeoxyribonuclease RuvC [Gammaproteobacteria bacterium]|nr:crossover junction endodeoxyribonuclease RuvC [Gammaproteobacteria bacterium]